MPNNLESWISHISDQEIPIFKHTVNAVSKVTRDDDTSANDLAKVVLQDSSLTARVLKISNSALYASDVKINTISRAISFVGFNTIRTISLSLAIIDGLLKGGAQNHVQEIMAQSLHAAVQARAFASTRNDDSPEEVFIASLLFRLGEMAFWCVAEKDGERILQIMEEKKCSSEKAQYSVLGFTFKELTVGLAKEWNLGDLLSTALNTSAQQNTRERSITLAQDIARSSRQSWSSQESVKILKNISQHIDLPEKTTHEMVYDNARDAVATARQYGASIAATLIPVSTEPSGDIEKQETPSFDPPKPNAVLQLNILRDLSAMLNESPNLGLIMETILEGIYRGIGMDRTVFAILTPDKKRLNAKYALGNNADEFAKAFSFDMQSQANIFQRALKENRSFWIKEENKEDYEEVLTEELQLALDSNNFYLSPVVVKNKPIGLFYADRKPSNRKLDAESYESLKHFSQQASMAILHMSSAR